MANSWCINISWHDVMLLKFSLSPMGSPWAKHPCLFPNPFRQTGNRVISSLARRMSGWMHTVANWHWDLQSRSLTRPLTPIRKAHHIDPYALLCSFSRSCPLFHWFVGDFCIFICTCQFDRPVIEGAIRSCLALAPWSLLKLEYLLRSI
jgi:hypothetical protein